RSRSNRRSPRPMPPNGTLLAAGTESAVDRWRRCEMATPRLTCPPAPGPLEEFAGQFDDLFGRLALRRAFRTYLTGLLSPRERPKTLTALAGAEPVVGAQDADVQRLQFFLSESPWDAAALDARRLELLLSDPATAPHAGA